MIAAAGAPARPIVPNFGSGNRCVVENHTFCWSWVNAHWGDTLQPALSQHVELSAIAIGIGFTIAFTTGLLTYRRRWMSRPLEGFSALLYTIPSLALFQILVPFTGITTTTVEVALVAYTLVMLFPNIVTGLNSVPADALDVARAMGFTRRQTLLSVELPLALPAIVAGLRVAVVSTVSLATIAAFLLPKGLGYPIFLALKEPSPFRTEIYAAGALTVALALVADLLLVALRRFLVPWARRGAV
jgi:osmoprotectant transport system permease protein